MRCQRCNKEFPVTTIGKDRLFSSEDQLHHYNVSYTYSLICPYCGYDNGLKVRM